MNRTFSFNKQDVALYLVATPIGNLEDITYRAVKILSMVDYIYAEDTRNSSVLLKHYDIKTPLYSYHEYNENLKSDEIIAHLKAGKNVAIISDAGLPVISDPGFTIAKIAIENQIAVTTIPGASAGISALVASGLPPMPYLFYGFLDSKHTARCKQLNDLKFVTNTIIFYESPHRIKQSLVDLLEVFGDRKIVLARELTKKFEEYIRGSISEVISVCDELKGEMVLLVSGYQLQVNKEVDIIKSINELISIGMKPNAAIKEVALENNLNKTDVYDRYVEYKNNLK